MGIIIMTIGFPACLFILLRAKKYTIKMDQLLRAADVGDTLESSANAEAYQTRLAYHKMYYHFLPGKTYWITYIIIRKGAIAAAALTFRANPGFQLAFVLLILFVAYVLQVKHRPYMSTAARDQALADHAEKVEMGDEDHILIASKIKKAREFKKTKEKRNQVRKKGFQLGAANKNEGRNKAQKKQHVYFWDYNTVEQVLLACAILVALAGVMFESDRFVNDKTNAFAWQREAITYIIIFIVVFSLVYYFVVFFSELYGKIPDWATRLAGRLRKNGLGNHGSQSISKADLSFFNNPLMAGDAVKLQKHKENADKAVADRDKQLQEQQEQNRMLLQRLRDAKKNQGQGAFSKKNTLANKRKAKANKKKQFTPQRMRDDSDVIEMAPIRNIRKV